MIVDIFTLLGFAAGVITSIGFIPQLIRGYRTKQLTDVSYWMPLVLTVGMALWLLYGVLRSDLAIMIANGVGVTCNILLVLLKKRYATKKVPGLHTIS